MATSKKAVAKYAKNHYDRIGLTVKKGDKEKIQNHAESMNESMNIFIKRAIMETMERDKIDRALERSGRNVKDD